jgi:hypothetical protein
MAHFSTAPAKAARAWETGPADLDESGQRGDQTAVLFGRSGTSRGDWAILIAASSPASGGTPKSRIGSACIELTRESCSTC